MILLEQIQNAWWMLIMGIIYPLIIKIIKPLLKRNGLLKIIAIIIHVSYFMGIWFGLYQISGAMLNDDQLIFFIIGILLSYLFYQPTLKLIFQGLVFGLKKIPLDKLKILVIIKLPKRRDSDEKE